MIAKMFTEIGNRCRVTFLVPPDIRARTVNLCGDFNGWSTSSHPMDRHPDGSFSLTLELKSGKDYCFRYFVDGYCWFNDDAADGYIYNQSDNLESVICLNHSQTQPSLNGAISETCVLIRRRGFARQVESEI
mgnify:FL=1